MSTKEAKQMDKALFDFYGKPSIGQALPLAIQHVLAMIVGCVTPSIIVAGVAGISQEDSVILIQAALVMSALTTLLQLFPFIKTKNFRIGSALPVMMESALRMFQVCRQLRLILTLQQFWVHRLSEVWLHFWWD